MRRTLTEQVSIMESELSLYKYRAVYQQRFNLFMQDCPGRRPGTWGMIYTDVAMDVITDLLLKVYELERVLYYD